MERKKNIKRIISGAVLGIFLLSGGIVLANTDLSGSSQDRLTKAGERGDAIKGGFSESLKQIVTDNIISQEQADQLAAFFQQKRDSMGDKKLDNTTDLAEAGDPEARGAKLDIWAEAVSSGIITQEQADAIKQAEQKLRNEERKNRSQTMANSLVEQGLLTEQEASAVVAYMEDYMEQMKSAAKPDMENLKDMTAEERKAYMEANKPEDKGAGPWSQLVDAGILSQAKVDAINQYLKSQMPERTDEMDQYKDGGLSQLVESGVITSQQSEAIIRQLESQSELRGTQKEAMKDMTEQERKAYMEQNQAQSTNPLQTLVDNGTITQEQADQISPRQSNKGGQGGGKGAGNFGEGPGQKE